MKSKFRDIYRDFESELSVSSLSKDLLFYYSIFPLSGILKGPLSYLVYECTHSSKYFFAYNNFTGKNLKFLRKNHE